MGNNASKLAEDTVIEDFDSTVDGSSSEDDHMFVDTELFDELPDGESLLYADVEGLGSDSDDSEDKKVAFGPFGVPYNPDLIEYNDDVFEYTAENNEIVNVFEKQFESIAKTGGNVLSAWLWISAHFHLCKVAGTWVPGKLTPERASELVKGYGEPLLRAARNSVKGISRYTATLGSNSIDMLASTADSPRWQDLLRQYALEGFDTEDLVMEFRKFLGQSPNLEEATDMLEQTFGNLEAETRLLVIAPALKEFYAEGDTASTLLTPTDQLQSPYGPRPSSRSLLTALKPTKLRIDGCPGGLTEHFLRHWVKQTGPTVSVRLVYDDNSKSTRSAFIIFGDSQHASEFQSRNHGLFMDTRVDGEWVHGQQLFVDFVNDDDEGNDDEFPSLENPVIIDTDNDTSSTSSLPPTVSRIPSMPSTPRTSDISNHFPSPTTPTFGQTFDDLTSGATSRTTSRKPQSRYKDPRIPRVDPLRYQNRLEEPRRLPKTPTASHWPPTPYSHRKKTPEPRACVTCGRAFRKSKTKAAGAGTGKKTAGRKTITGRVKKTVTVAPKKYELRSRKQ